MNDGTLQSVAVAAVDVPPFLGSPSLSTAAPAGCFPPLSLLAIPFPAVPFSPHSAEEAVEPPENLLLLLLVADGLRLLRERPLLKTP